MPSCEANEIDPFAYWRDLFAATPSTGAKPTSVLLKHIRIEPDGHGAALATQGDGSRRRAASLSC
jgi:hypothetical protein